MISTERQYTPQLNKQELDLLYCILHHIKRNMQFYKNSRYAFSESEFYFDIDYGVYDTFRSLCSKIETYSEEMFEKEDLIHSKSI